MYQTELSKLNAFDMTDALITFTITFGMSVGAYFLDGARIAAFGLFPVLGAFQYAQQRGITRKNTPRLYWTISFVSLAVFLVASYWALSHPKH